MVTPHFLQIIPSLEGVSDAVDKQLGGKLRVMGTQQGKQFSRGVGVGLKDLERDVDSAGRAYQRLKDKAADALGKVRTEEAALKRLRDSGASDDRVIRSEERLATARRNSSRASREASDGHKALEAAQGASAASAVVAGGAFGKLSTLAAGAGTALLSAGAIAGGAALAGIAALGAGVLVAGNRLYELGAQFDDLSDNLQIKTGLSGSALEELKGHIEKLGTTNVPSTFAEIGNVAAEVTRNLHLTGPAFDDVTSRLANLQRMGVDVDVRSLGKAFRGFGIDAQAQAPALNSLYEASTKSGLSIDDLTGAVTKGGPALRQLGLDFGASAALIANFEAAGLDGEKGMTALTKATTYFAKQNIPAKQGLQDTIAQIQKLGDQPAAVDLANKVFGAKGGAAFNEAIQNGTLDLQSLSDSLSTTGIDINQVSDDTADWSEKWQILKNNVSSALEPMATGLFDAVNEQLAGLSDSLLAHKDEIVGFFETLGDLAITGAENMSHGIGGILQALGDMVGGIGNVKGVLDDLMGDFATLRGDNAAATAFHASAQEAYGWGESLRAAGDKLANLNLDGLRQGLHNVGDAARTSNTEVGGLGSALGALPSDKSITVHADTAPAEETMQAWWKKWKSVIAAAPGGGDDTDHPVIHSTDKPPPGSSAVQPVPSLLDPNRPQFRATGGSVVGAGGPKSDIIPIWASNGEHMLTASDVQAMGGQAGVYAFRNMLHRSGGGSILPMAQIPWPPGKINKTGDRAGNLPNLDSGFNPSQRALPWLLDPDSPIPSGPPGVPLPPTDDDILFPDLQPPWIQDWLKKHPPSSWKNPRRNMLLGAGLGFANGGAVGPDVRVAGELVGTAYSQAKRTDCCLVGSSMVYGPNGAKPISELVAGDEVYAFSDRKAVSRKVIAAWQSAMQPVFRVRTRNRAVVASANHPFMVVRGGDVTWLRLDQLTRGDLLVQPRALDLRDADAVLPDGTCVTPEIAWFVGALIGDGTVSKPAAGSGKNIRLCMYGENRERAERIVQTTWGGNCRRSPSSGLVISGVPDQVDALLEMGLHYRGANKRIPGAVWSWNEKLQRAFLDGYCDADGYRPKDTVKYGDRSYSSCSRRLIDDVRALHIMLGDSVANVTVNTRVAPITIKGKAVRTALPLHTFAVSLPHRANAEARLRDRTALRRWLDDNDFTLSRLLGITPEGTQDTYDIEVEDDHNFIADGIVVHNSGMVARVIDRTLGMSESGLMSTKNAAEWLAARGFVPGSGGPGQISVGWYDHGPNPNDGHMAMTLSDGSNAEAGGGVGDIFQIGGGAAGASSPEFDQHMYLPTVYGEGPASSGSASSPFAGGSATAAATGAAPTSSGGDAAPSSSSGSVSLPSSFTGFGGFAGEQLGKQLGDEKLGKLTSAAGSLIDGQVSSALDVFGIPGSPGWLQGISTLIGGISIGGGSSANPLAANQQPFTNASGDAANMHGTHAAQAPGPTYNITARDTEDAFIKAQRLEREKAAAKLSRF